MPLVVILERQQICGFEYAARMKLNIALNVLYCLELPKTISLQAFIIVYQEWQTLHLSAC